MAESAIPHRGGLPPNDSPAAARMAFPQTEDDFKTDPRVAYSQLDEKWILEDDDGSEWEYDENQKRWIQAVSLTSPRDLYIP